MLLLQPTCIVLTAAGVTGTTASVIKRWNVSVQMSWRVATKLWDRLAHNHGSAAKVPVLNVDISAAALLVHLDASSLKSLLGLAAAMLHFFQYREYRRLRPQVRSCTVLNFCCMSTALSWCLRMRFANMLHLLPVGTLAQCIAQLKYAVLAALSCLECCCLRSLHCFWRRFVMCMQVAVSTAPQNWWQHAVHAVLREREHLQGSDQAQMACVARRHLRIQYCKVYKRHIRSTSW